MNKYVKYKKAVERLRKYCMKHDKTAVFHYFPSGNISMVIGEMVRRDRDLTNLINKTLDACEAPPLTSVDLANAMYKL